MEEEWKEVNDYDDYYISNYGRLKSIKRNKEIIKKPKIDNGGYLRIGLNKENKQKLYSIHRLVALHFVENPDPKNKIQVNHIDGNKLNNHFTNLEWVTVSENALHSYKLGLSKFNEKQKQKVTQNIIKYNKSRRKPVNQLSLDGNFIRKWESAKKVEDETGYFAGDIAKCCKGKKLTCGGYKWEYA